MKSLRMLIIAAVIAMPVLPAMAHHYTTSGPVDLATGSCPVNLKVMPMASVVAPTSINVQISTIKSGNGGYTGNGGQNQNSAMGSSSGNDYGTFLISTNLDLVQLTASIGNPGLTGGHWYCHLQGHNVWKDDTDSDNYPGPIPANTPFNVFVWVTDVDMTAVAFVDSFVYDTTLTVTMSIP